MFLQEYKSLNGHLPTQDMDSIIGFEWDAVSEILNDLQQDTELVEMFHNQVIDEHGTSFDLADKLQDMAINEYLLWREELETKFDLPVDFDN